VKSEEKEYLTGRFDIGKIRDKRQSTIAPNRGDDAVFNSRRDNVGLSSGTSDGKLPLDSIS